VSRKRRKPAGGSLAPVSDPRSRVPGAASRAADPRPSSQPARPGGASARRAESEQLAREALKPLGEHERPAPLLAAVAVCAVLALAVLAGAATVHDLRSRGGSLPGAIAIAAVLALLAQGMYRRRYWAVLSFEALLAFQVIVTSLALIVAATITAAAICLVGIGLGGWLFWKLVRVMGRIQAGERDAIEL
jgi:hypothetical protein